MAQMTPAEAMEHRAARMYEDFLQDLVRQACEARRYLYYHTYRSKRSPAGFPDCVIILPNEVIYAELKREKNRPTHDQVAWLDGLSDRGSRCFLWRPRHWLRGEIAKVLGGEEDCYQMGRWVPPELRNGVDYPVNGDPHSRPARARV